MKTLRFFNYANILAAFAALTAPQLNAQQSTYVTLQSGQNYALQTNQTVKVVGVGYSTYNGGSSLTFPTIVGSFPGGSLVSVGAGGSYNASAFPGQGMIFTGLTNVTVIGNCGTFEIKTLPCYNPNTLPVIPQGRSALVQVQSTYDLASGQWTTLYSQAFTNTTGTNQFFTFTLSAP